jgi:FkbM family methyltransferase
MSATPKYVGSAEALKWTIRDLPRLDQTIPFCQGRTAVIQAGGNLGLYAKRLARDFQTVYSFEPDPELFRLMQVNAPEANILRYQAALGDERRLVGTSRIRRDGKPNNHEGITHIAGEGNIPTLRIDDLGLATCELMVLDLEGWELFALRGARETLARCRPVVSVEINKSIGFVGFDGDDVRQVLHEASYGRVLILGSDEIYVPLEQIDRHG